MTYCSTQPTIDPQALSRGSDGGLLQQQCTVGVSSGEDQRYEECIEVVIGATNDPVCKLTLADGSFTLVDPEDYAWVSKHTWRRNDSGGGRYYVYRWKGRRKIYLHREIMKASESQHIDHVDGNPMNNRKVNLRPTDARGNAQNRVKCERFKGRPPSSPYKGVYWDSYHRKYRAEITCGGERHRLGRYSDPGDAAQAYDLKAIELFGEFAWTNFDYAKEDRIETISPELAEIGSGREAA